MNNSFIFTQIATAGGVEGRESRVEGKSPTHSRFSDGSTLPFSNVLDRAVQTPPKKVAEKLKQESLAGGCSEEHRSARSVEAHEEHKPSAPPRGSKRQEKRDDEITIQPAAFSGMPTPVVKQDEKSPASGTSDAMSESPITVEDCSAQKTSVEAVAGKITATQGADATEPTAGSAEINLESLALVEGDEVAIAGKPAVDLKQIEQALVQDAAQPPKVIALDVERPSTTAAGVLLSEDAMTQTSLIDAADLRAMAASTVREAMRGTTHEESNSNASIETPEVATAADAAAVESVIVTPITAEEVRRSARSDRRPESFRGEKVRGTATAKLAMSMNNEANREEIAGLTEQILPSGGVSQLATGINLSSESQRISAKENIGVDSLNAAARLTTGPARTDVSSNTDLLELREASPAARIGEVISREVRMFKRGGDDMVEVVLTPDAKTQISLKLQWRDGQVEVQARCDMGDHQLLNTQWPQLQASFAAHGVRLSHLSERAHTGFTEFFGNSGFSQQQGGERQPAPQQSAVDMMKPVVPTTKPGAARSVVRSGNRLESWA